VARIDTFLQLGFEQGCSDVHIAVGSPPLLRLFGDLVPVKYRDLTADELTMLVDEMLTEAQRQEFRETQELDFSYTAEGVGRFRVNLFQKIGGIGATFRVIAARPPKIDDLGLPSVVKKLTSVRHGLVLVTGAAGMGKSSTLAAMVDHLNDTRRLNIVTLEDPIEYVHQSNKSLIKQREIGLHVPGFATGIRDALRQDPDVILVGELRDTETISMAMEAAETGHLVFGTLHTTGAAKTLDRFLDGLPEDKRPAGKMFLAHNLKGVVSQCLVRKCDNRGKTAIAEIMVMTDAIANLILADKTFQIAASMQTGRDLGMQLMDQALLQAVQRKEVDPDDAYSHANDKKLLQTFVTDPKLVPKMALLAS
jgi:twitching motility protein PilT